jgi:pimeloyl-ACP methyl ester carboxylesterase
MRNERVVRSTTALLATAFMFWSTVAAAQEAAGPKSRAEATKIVAEMRRIVSPEGIERLESVRIGGIDQWISVRGVDRRNPVLLMLHGGPGYASMPNAWYFQRGWEDYFTVVQWDQRGAGKTYTANDPAKVAPTLTTARMIADTEEMITWLRREFGKDRIFVLGHSWGSFLGLSIAERHPEWLHAYIGMGQLIDGLESERRGWRFAMDRARQAKNEEAVRELESIASYGEDGQPIVLKSLYIQRKWLGFYGGAIRGRTGEGFDAESAAVSLAPEYSDADVESFWAGNELSEGRLLAEVLKTDFSRVTKLACPLILFNGRDDYNVSATLAAEWFSRVQAPSKALVWFERSAHMMMNEEPGRMLVALVEHALPIAKRAGDVAPY